MERIKMQTESGMKKIVLLIGTLAINQEDLIIVQWIFVSYSSGYAYW